MSNEVKVPIQLSITPEQINQMIAQAVLDSKLGEEIKRVVKQKCEQLHSYQFTNLIEKVVEDEMKRMVQQVVMTHHSDQIRELIKTKITEKVTDEFVDKIWKSVESRW